MKLENHDQEKIDLIVNDAAEAADLTFALLAFKKEDSPQFEVKLTWPPDYKYVKEKIFGQSVNPFLNGVCVSGRAAFAESAQEGFKNIVSRSDLETLVHESKSNGAGLCPIILEKDVQALFFFLCREPSNRLLKTVDAFARVIAMTQSVREYQRIAHDANLKATTMSETTQDAFFTIDTQTGKISVSPRLEEMTGYKPDEFHAGLIDPEKYVVKEDLAKVKSFYGDAFAGKKVEVEFRMQRKDGNVIWFSIYSNPIFDSTGKLVAIQGVGKDVSAHKVATTELEKAREREQMKTEFMSIISHELRTPLTPIRGYIDLLLSEQLGKLSPEQKNALETVKKQSRHLLILIDSVLDIARVEYGKPIEIKKEPISLAAIIQDVFSGMEFQFKEKEIKTLNISTEIETILADEAKITQVVNNLVGNALKFTPKKGEIGLRTRKVGDAVQIEVWDTGLGIEEKNRGKIFEKFYQVDSSYTRAAGGIGMGLAIVKEIVEAHGGKVWVESAGLGKGAKFIFTLPLT
jgi:PAS domain S-box-containing protein